MKYIVRVVLLLLVGTNALHAQDVAGDLLNRVNTLRASLGLPPYTLNGALTAAAQSQAQWMADTGNVSHTRPDGSTPRTRAAMAGYSSTWVSENIYMGSLATVDSAWAFWINSPIHYAGLTNPNYRDIGIGSAHTNASGTAFVLVFGNPGDSLPVVSQPGASQGNASASKAPPSYVVGVDAQGNIMHEIQEGDTLGDIALIYGYTWEDIPAMLQLNGLTEADARTLEVGSIFLVPPKAGTYTPTPLSQEDAMTTTAAVPAATVTPDERLMAPTNLAQAFVEVASLVPSPVPTLTPLRIATAVSVPEALLSFAASPTPPVEITPVAAIATSLPETGMQGFTIVRSEPSPWLVVAVGVQVGAILVAAVEFIRRLRR